MKRILSILFMAVLSVSAQAQNKKSKDYPPPPPPQQPATANNVFLKRNPGVQRLAVSTPHGASMIHVYLKNGSKESYNLKLASEEKAFVAKYGQVPPPPPPPPSRS